MKKLRLNEIGGNWKTTAFILINKLVGKNEPKFSRSEIMTLEHLDFTVWLTSLCGHRKDPKACEQTLQGTLQSMRDEKLIDFLGLGEYRLTKAGYAEMDRMAGRLPYHELKKAMTEYPIKKNLD